jgi:hypothetical protein
MGNSGPVPPTLRAFDRDKRHATGVDVERGFLAEFLCLSLIDQKELTGSLRARIFDAGGCVVHEREPIGSDTTDGRHDHDMSERSRTGSVAEWEIAEDVVPPPQHQLRPKRSR